MLILGIETSCDETAVAVVENGKKIVSSLISSQIALHRVYQGIVPEIAARKHLEKINPLIDLVLKNAKINFSGLDGVAVTAGPGLIGSLLTGVMAAKSISYSFHLPLIGVNHLEGHLLANFLLEKKPAFPFLGLIISGGHTQLVYLPGLGKYRILGETRDDAVGEALDKTAKFLNLGYPGGPIIEKLAKKGNPQAITFPRPRLPGSWDFSFSGLKTALINFSTGRSTFKTTVPREKITPADIVASFQQAVVEVVTEKTLKAAKHLGVKNIVIGGGVSANGFLRREFARLAEKDKMKIFFPPLELCTDNAAMIACAGYYKLKKSKKLPAIKIDPNLPLQDWK
ncbi:MAG: tRNA (adenosine(37)-N6)-threonylcarbamoyltransferase complex transferase subunit TsaD [Elusimicrobiota bacterium]